jgi:hypothetical protein
VVERPDGTREGDADGELQSGDDRSVSSATPGPYRSGAVHAAAGACSSQAPAGSCFAESCRAGDWGPGGPGRRARATDARARTWRVVPHAGSRSGPRVLAVITP